MLLGQDGGNGAVSQLPPPRSTSDDDALTADIMTLADLVGDADTGISMVLRIIEVITIANVYFMPVSFAIRNE
jgi:hypothetical protein